MVAIEPPAGPNRFEIDGAAIAANVGAVRRLVGRGVWLCAALKADAYGFGLLPVARIAVAAGADAVAVGSVADGLRLRTAGIEAPVLVYGGDVLDARSVAALEGAGLTATVFDRPSLAACLAHARRRLAVLIEVDVGLRRLGFEPSGAAAAAAQVRACGRLELLGVYTHLRVDPGAEDSLRAQFGAFGAALDAVGGGGLRMAASSRVLDRFPEMALNAVDPGRALYGLLAGGRGRLGPHLRPAFAALRSRLLTVRPLSTGPLGVIPFGRAAGMAALSAGCVLVRGRRAALVGAPSLEHTRIDLGSVPGAEAGDEVVIVGAQGDDRITLDEVLRANPELPETALALQVGPSVPRAFV